MPLIPWKYIKEHLLLPEIPLREIGEKLTYYGLETKIVERKNSLYLEIDVLPNRPDLLSWWGIIQEIGIILNCQVKPPNPPVLNKSKEKLIEVIINSDNCSEFYLYLIKNVKVKESPDWIKEWLALNNIRSINNIVDIANLVMLESGQPLHTFDYDTLPGKKITIRQAHQGERINALHGNELMLSSEDVVISSGERVISLAGIIGDQTTAITPHTKNILIECASFNSPTIKKTAKRLNVSTDASQFFSRGANSVFPPQLALNRFASLITDICQNDSDSKIVFSSPKKREVLAVVRISQEFITKKVGQALTQQTIENIWRQLRFSYRKEENNYYITIPLSRPDIVIPEDLLEELLRIYDYNKVISSLP